MVAYLYHHHHPRPTYDGSIPAGLIVYTDVDWAGCLDAWCSMSTRIFMSMGAALMWAASKQQHTEATSSAEAKYTAASDCAHEAV